MRPVQFEERGKEHLEPVGREWLKITDENGNKWGVIPGQGGLKWDLEQDQNFTSKESGSQRKKKGVET